MAYTNKLIQQLTLTDPILVQLQTRINFLENKAAPMQKAIDVKMNAILNAHEEEDMSLFIPKITANLR